MTDKKDLILSVIENINFKDDSQWSVSLIKHELKRVLGEEPAIKINYEKDVVLNEFNKEATEIEKLTSIEVIYSENTNADSNVVVRRAKFDINI